MIQSHTRGDDKGFQSPAPRTAKAAATASAASGGGSRGGGGGASMDDDGDGVPYATPTNSNNSSSNGKRAKKKAKKGGENGGAGGTARPNPVAVANVDRAAGEGHWANIMNNSKSLFFFGWLLCCCFVRYRVSFEAAAGFSTKNKTKRVCRGSAFH